MIGVFIMLRKHLPKRWASKLKKTINYSRALKAVEKGVVENLQECLST